MRHAIGGMVRLERKRRGMLVRGLARQLGITESYLIDVEGGRRIPSESLALRMSYWLETGEGSQKVVERLIKPIDLALTLCGLFALC